MSVPHLEDTIVALSSSPGPGRRAIVRLTGPDTRNVVRVVFTPWADRPPAAGRISSGELRLTGVNAGLPADLYTWSAPHTYTGQHLSELHVPSSPPLVDRLISDLLAAGSRAAQPGEFTLRAFLAGKKDLTQAEAVHAVIEAGTDAELRAALTQLAGGVALPLDRLRTDLLDLLADVEAGLDFADEDITFVSSADVLGRVGTGLAHLTNLQRQFDEREVSRRTVRVALVGEPNAGKSSLFNALARGSTAIVSSEAGTTRDYLTTEIDLGGIPVELIDTAGWQHSRDTIEEQSQRLGREQVARADLVLWCVPGNATVDPQWQTRLPQMIGADVLIVRTKCDEGPWGHESGYALSSSTVVAGGTTALRAALRERIAVFTRPSLAPSQSRCRHHVGAAIEALCRTHEHAREGDPPELLALALREALDQVGAMTGAIHTEDLLDRIFSRFCIGK